jgi:uncharacterized protein YjbI with pentapeptide repeats/DNA-binding XRE family transcriptional regulator
MEIWVKQQQRRNRKRRGHTAMEISIGNKISEARKAKNMSQAQLAQKLSVSSQAVGKWERGESMPDIVMFSRLAKVLGVDLNYFSEDFPSSAAEISPAETPAEQPPVQPEAIEPSSSPERTVLIQFSGSNLPDTDFAGVTAHNRKFDGSALRGSNFARADLTGSTFKGSDVREVIFDGANLTDCTLSASDLSGASFNKTILVRTGFNTSGLARAKFIEAKLVDVKLTYTDLRETVFEACSFQGVDFKYADLRKVCLDGQTFMDVSFDMASLNDVSFRGATLRNVAFRASASLTNKFYRAIKTICFDGATMDKLTYAGFKGYGADLSKVTTI